MNTCVRCGKEVEEGKEYCEECRQIEEEEAEGEKKEEKAEEMAEEKAAEEEKTETAKPEELVEEDKRWKEEENKELTKEEEERGEDTEELKAEGPEKKEKVKEAGKTSKFSFDIIKDVYTGFAKHKSLLLIIAVVAVLVALFFIVNQPMKQKEINVEFLDVPGEYDKSVMLALFYDHPLNSTEISELDIFLSAMENASIPITLFFTSQGVNSTDVNDYFTNEPEVGFDMGFLHEYSIVEVAGAGYINAPYTSLSYDDQEQFIKQTKKAFRKQGFNISGLMIPGGKYNVDTLLAIENNKLDYAVSFDPMDKPYHPPSLLGGKMSLLIFPVSSGMLNGTEKGVNVFLINNKVLMELAMQMQFGMDAFGDFGNAWVTDMSSQKEYIREKDKISAQLVTNLRKKQSSMTINNLFDNVGVRIETELEPLNITGGNTTVEFDKFDSGFEFVLDEKQSSVLILWD